MKITKKEIKENTKTKEIENGRFGRSFKHYFKKKVKDENIDRVCFSYYAGEITVTVYWTNPTKEPIYDLRYTEEGKNGFIEEVQDYIQSL